MNQLKFYTIPVFGADRYEEDINHFLRSHRVIPGYLRYMNDLLLFSNDKLQLKNALNAFNRILAEQLSLDVKARSVALNRTLSGFNYLGYRIFPSHRKLNKRSRVRYSGKVKYLHSQFEKGLIEEGAFQRKLQSMTEYVLHCKSYNFRQSILGKGHMARTV